MAAGDPMESEACPAPIRPADPDTGQVLHLFGCSYLCCELTALRRQFLHILLQLSRKRRFVQIQPQDQWSGHPGKYRMELGQHAPRKKCAVCFGGYRCFFCPAHRSFGMDAGLFLHGGAQVFQLRGGKGAVSHGGNHLAQRLDTYITCGVQAVRSCLLAPVCEDIALVIQFSQAAHQLRGRLITGKNEHAEGLSVRRMVLGHLTGFGIPVPEIAERSVAGHLLHLCVGENGDLLVVSGCIRCCLGAGEVVSPDENGHLAGVLGQEHALLRRSKAAAHHKDIFPGEELSVAGGAVGHAPPTELLLPLEAHHAGMGAGGQEDTEAPQIAPAGAYGLYVTGELQPGDLGQQKFSAEALRLLPHGLGKLRPTGPAHAGIVHHFRGNGDLPAEVVLLHDHYPVAGTGQVEGGSESRWTAADDHDIVEICRLLHGLKLPHQIQTGLQSLGARLPLRRAYLVSVLRHELARLYLPQQLVGVPAHIAGVDLIGHDFSLGVDNEAAPLRHAVGFNVDLKILCQTMCGIGQHGILDLLDALGGVMPRLMDKVGIAGNGVNFAADGLEFIVEVCQVLQLRGAHKGEVGGIEEKHAPLSQYIRLGSGAEGVILIALDGEIGNFFLNQGHRNTSIHNFAG